MRTLQRLINILPLRGTEGEKNITKQYIRVFLRYALVYIAYTVILFGLLFTVIQISHSTLKNKTLRIAEETLRTGMNELETTFATYDQTALVFFDAPEIKLATTSLTNNSYSIYKAHNFFIRMIRTLENRPECGLYLTNGTLLTGFGIHTDPKQYYDTIFSCEEFPEYEDWIQTLWQDSRPSFIPEMHYSSISSFSTIQREIEAILYVNRHENGSQRRLFYVVIPTERLKEAILPDSTNLTGNLTFSTVEDGTIVRIAEINAFAPEACSNTVSFTGASGLTVTLSIADSVFNEEMQEAMVGYWILAIAFILIGLIFAVILAYNSTRPIAILMNAATQLDTTGKVTDTMQRLNREYSTIFSTLSLSGKALENYEKELNRFARETRYWAFIGMLMGENTDQYLKLNAPPYVLVLLRAENGSHESAELLLPLLRNTLSVNAISSGSLCALIANSVVLLIPEAKYSRLKSPIESILSGVSELNLKQISIPALETVQEIRDAYAQASYTLNILGSGQTELYTTPLAAADTGFENEAERITQFSAPTVLQFLQNGQIQPLIDMLDEWCTFFRTGSYTDEQYVRYVFESCTVGLRLLRTKFPELEAEFTIPAWSTSTEANVQFAAMKDSLIAAHKIVSTFYAEKSMSKAGEIVDYISRNIGNPNLYTKLVTEEFGITEKELQKQVQSLTGMSFFSFVEKLRMDEAKRLLLTTDYTVTKIGELCGYSSKISFSRAFSRFYDTTPLKMRNGEKKES